MTLARTVQESLNNALEGGYTDLLEWSDERVADDMLDYCADVEGCSAEDLIPHIKSWRSRHVDAKR